MSVLSFVCDDQHRRFVGGSLHVFPCWAATYAAALVIAPWIWRSFDRLLSVFPPRELVRGNIRRFRTYRGNSYRVLHARFSFFRAMAAARGVVGVAVAFLPVGGRERRLSDGDGRGRREEKRGSLLSVRDAAVSGDRRQERRVPRRHRRDREVLLRRSQRLYPSGWARARARLREIDR
eukprot:TRINITY_DN5589_c0_g2_i2.p2 TRINITY_DN5589_c0_g2~~TRINITY_DN5589_c0_g2_i2.p2  ORF type:complete len:178 (-),score=2.22 TRINITY_DN5589_c0_g2_i2:717-1250(-)